MSLAAKSAKVESILFVFSLPVCYSQFLPSQFPLSTLWFVAGRGPAQSSLIRGSRQSSAPSIRSAVCLAPINARPLACIWLAMLRPFALTAFRLTSARDARSRSTHYRARAAHRTLRLVLALSSQGVSKSSVPGSGSSCPNSGAWPRGRPPGSALPPAACAPLRPAGRSGFRRWRAAAKPGRA